MDTCPLHSRCTPRRPSIPEAHDRRVNDCWRNSRQCNGSHHQPNLGHKHANDSPLDGLAVVDPLPLHRSETPQTLHNQHSTLPLPRGRACRSLRRCSSCTGTRYKPDFTIHNIRAVEGCTGEKARKGLAQRCVFPRSDREAIGNEYHVSVYHDQKPDACGEE